VATATLRFLRRFMRPEQDVAHERELLFQVAGEPRSATVYLPDQPVRAGPAWILLHGVTVPGRHHVGVRRMARALAAAGHTALVPEIPSWTALRVDPREAEPVVRGALLLLIGMPGVDHRRAGLVGFSVAATWALEVAAGDLGDDLRAVVGVGGYGDLRCTIRAMITGEHEWRGRRYRYAPDPYGRWIVGADLLPRIDDNAYGTHEERKAAAGALHRLAHTAGRNGALAREPVYDPLIAALRETVPVGALPAWDLVAPMSGQPVPDPSAGRALADALAEAGLRANPELDPAGRLRAATANVILLHGRHDRLIPFTETRRLARFLSPRQRPTVTITALIGHAKTAEAGPPRSPVALAREVWRFARTIRRILASPGGDLPV
jgi:hypothetical protein